MKYYMDFPYVVYFHKFILVHNYEICSSYESVTLYTLQVQ